MDLTPAKLGELGLTPEEGQDLLRLTTKLEQNHQAMVRNGEVARGSFSEWLSDVLPKVGKALGVAADAISKILRSVAAVINALN